MSIKKIEKLNDLISQYNVPISQNHRSSFSIYEIIHSLSKQINDELIGLLQMNRFFGIMIDDSDDISKSKNLILYCKDLNKKYFEFQTKYLKLFALEELTAVIFHNIVKNYLTGNKLYWKVIGFNSDHAKVVSSAENGVAGLLLLDLPYLFHFTCAANALNLASSDLSNQFEIVDHIFQTIYDAHSYFKKSDSGFLLLKEQEEKTLANSISLLRPLKSIVFRFRKI